MKLHRLELTGFGPFLDTQTVDFDAFDADGLFLISGRTGAGKSSILDGVSFALYGSVPRYDGGERRLRSDHCAVSDPTEVRLEFSIGDRRWRVTRAPEYERPAKRGGGLTTEAARAELEELVGGEWIGRAAKLREVGIALDEILGLNAQQFQQVILLAQNKFSRFLLAGNDERQTLLRTLFGTRRFAQYKDELDLRRREAQKTLDAVGERARTLLDQAERLIAEHALADRDADGEPLPAPTELSARRDAAARAAQRADYRVEQAETELALAETAQRAAVAAHADLTARAQRAAERAAVRVRLAELEQAAPQMTDDRARLDRARAAETVRAVLETAERAVAARELAAVAVDDAARNWRDAVAGVVDLPTGAELDALIERLTGDLARWRAAAEQEAALAAAEQALAALERQIAELTAARAELQTQQAQLPARRAELDEALTAARALTARTDDVRARRETLVARLAGAREAGGLTADVDKAAAAHASAAQAAVSAAEHWAALVRRRLAGFAGELSAALVPGEPCAVCGSTEHPHPAAPADDPVTDDDQARAEIERDRALAAEQAAAEALRSLRERLASARERAGGQDVETVQAELTAVEQEAAEIAEAAQTEARLMAERIELEALATAAQAELETVNGQLAQARERHAAQKSELTGRRAEVDAARGGYATVVERVDAVTAERDCARAVAEARTALAERERAAADAIADRDARVAEAGFAEPAAAAAALLTAAEQAALDTAIATHAAELSAARARLLELELDVELTDVGVDELAASADAVAAADAARSAAIAAGRDAANTASSLRDLLQQTDDAYSSVAEAADEAAVITRLADTVSGRAPNTMKMELETFVLAAELEEIVAAANLRLEEMSSGRYTLHHSDAKASRGRASGLGIEVLDAHTGRLRSPHSLSGGETFLASLALALGLAEVVTSRAGGLRLDTLFVDEGFGSLDPETLELAMRTLDELRAGGRTVGVISHVEAMKEQLPAQVVVTATSEGPSVITQ